MSIPDRLTLHEFKQIPIDRIFKSVSSEQQNVTVQMPDGSQVIIHSKPELKPLTLLKGKLPKGWKKSIYQDPE